MSIGYVLIELQASCKGGRGVTSDEFLAPLDIRAGQVEATRADGSECASGIVYFAVIRHSDFDHVDKSADARAQSEAFFAGIVEAFRATRRFLDQRSPSVTTAMRTAGLSLRLFVEVHTDQDQMELELPAELLAACGRHNLSVYVISNDVPAHELWAAHRGLTNG